MELNISLSQKLSLSQRMVLSAKILQMSSLELNDYLKDLSEGNPIIEYTEKEAEQNKFDTLRKKLEWLDAGDEQNRYYYSEDREDEANNDNWNFRIYDSDTLEEYLLSQINMQKLPEHIKKAAEFTVKSLDENGYLKETAETISAFCGISAEDAQKAIDLSKSLDPLGVCAYDLRECLLIQLLSEINPDITAIEIVKNHLDLLARNQIKTISKLLNTSIDDVIQSVHKIKTLNPRPGAGFSSNESLNYIIPDAYIYKNKNGDYEISLSDFYSPKIKINGYYKNIIRVSDDTSTKEYIRTKLNQAEWVIKCIDKRNSTFTSTLKLIVDKQINFFENGTGQLVPMKLSDISSKLNFHDSTVSRAIRDKYIQCRHGVFPVAYFFTCAASSSASNKNKTASQESVKNRIKEIINNENKFKPLSDREISELLNEEGISVSRRTVAKYREAMEIGGTSIRKDFKKH